MEVSPPDAEAHLLRLAYAKMPFGKFKGWYLIDLPEAYVLYFKQNGYPSGEIGDLLREVHEMQVQGLDRVVRSLRSPGSENEFRL